MKSQRLAPEWRDLDAYPFRVEVAPRWSDMDMVGHMNNVSLGLIYQEARARFMVAIEAALPAGETPIRRVIAEVSIQYLAETHYPAMFSVGCRMGEIGTSSYDMAMGLFQHGRCVGACSTVFVHSAEGRTLPLSDAWRSLLSALSSRKGEARLTPQATASALESERSYLSVPFSLL